MKTIQVTLYTFDELPTYEAKERARDWYRRVDTFEPDFERDEFLELLTALGFRVDTRQRQYANGSTVSEPLLNYEVGYRRSYACFDASWRADRVDAKACATIKSVRPNDIETHRIIDAMQTLAKQFPDAIGKAESDRRYGTQSADFDTGDDKTSAEAIQTFYDIVQSLANVFASALAAQYEYENSDEYIDDCLIANEYDFTINGERAP